MKKQKEYKPITVEIINPEALGYVSEVITKYYYKKYLEMRSMEIRLNSRKNEEIIPKD